MIRKVPNMSAWVMRWRDFNLFEYVNNIYVPAAFMLPLFDIYPRCTDINFEDDQLILIIDAFTNLRPFTLEQIEEINKTWDKFYE